MNRTKLADRELPNYSKGEEIFNFVSHIVGGALSVAALVICIVIAAIHGNGYGVVASCIYGVCMICLYTMSSIYHGLRKGTAKKVFQVIDHCTIYFMIAGSYMPVALCAIREQNTALGWVLFGVIWALTALATTLTAIDLEKFNKFSMVCYIGMGWCVVFCFKALYAAVGLGGIIWFLVGGLMYTIGAVIYSYDKKYAHCVFHVFVILGSVAHFFAIILYIL
ncbi:MAG: hemolysin III family protein [Lachnospirales bacterium]